MSTTAGAADQPGPCTPGATFAVRDEVLMAAVRGGDAAAFALLYRRHRHAAARQARVLVGDPSDVEDLVAEAFAKVLAALRTGGGPRSFRSYLLTAVRHTCYDRRRRDRRVEFTDDQARYELADPVDAGQAAVARLERRYAVRAFARLPQRSQVVLWRTAVEGAPAATVAGELGLAADAVRALAYRARERLRQMYLQEHLAAAVGSPVCCQATNRLGAYVRGRLPRTQRARVQAHLANCAACTRRCAELTEVNARLPGKGPAGSLLRPPVAGRDLVAAHQVQSSAIQQRPDD